MDHTRKPRVDYCRHEWNSIPGPDLLVVPNCIHCNSTVLDALQSFMIQLYRQREKNKKWIHKIKVEKKKRREMQGNLEEKLVRAESMADRLTEALADNYTLRAQLARVMERMHRKGAA
jgi:tRNA nucleotidyltransferase/poly(A) polymerase